MPKFARFALYAFLISAPMSNPVLAHDATIKSAELVRPLSRTTIVVQDIEAALPLFRDILGMNIKTDLQLEGAAVNKLLGTGDKKMRIVILNVAESEIGNIALLAFDEPGSMAEHESAQGNQKSVRTGQTVLVMETLNIDTVEQKARQAGYTIISKPMVIFNRPNMATQSREMVFIGPESVVINLIERGLPAKASE